MRLTLLGSGGVAPDIFPSDMGTIQVLTMIDKGLTTTYYHLCPCPLCYSHTALRVEQAGGTGWTSFCLRPASLRSFTQLAHSLTWFRCVLRCQPICHYPLAVFQVTLRIYYIFICSFIFYCLYPLLLNFCRALFCSCSIFNIYHSDWHTVLNKYLLKKEKMTLMDMTGALGNVRVSSRDSQFTTTI